MKKSTVRIVDSIEIVRRKDLLYFNYHGTGFLQNMVRILTGTLLEVGQGQAHARERQSRPRSQRPHPSRLHCSPTRPLPDAGRLLTPPHQKGSLSEELSAVG